MNACADSTATDRLLKRVATGDEQALDELFAKYRGYLRKLIDLRMDDDLRVRVDPSDVVQETQYEANRRLDDFLTRRPASFRIWLRRKALERLVDLRRRHLNAERRSARREIMLSDCSSIALAHGLPVESPSRQMTRKEQAQQVRQTVQTLRDADREILLLRHVEELTNAEAADVLQIDPATASQRYGRALRRLRAALSGTGLSHDG